jgi:alkaline phosphatase D
MQEQVELSAAPVDVKISPPDSEPPSAGPSAEEDAGAEKTQPARDCSWFWCRVFFDWIWFVYLLAATLAIGLLIVSFSYIFIQQLPAYQVMAILELFYIIYLPVFVLPLVLVWWWRGRCGTGREAEVADIFASPPSLRKDSYRGEGATDIAQQPSRWEEFGQTAIVAFRRDGYRYQCGALTFFVFFVFAWTVPVYLVRFNYQFDSNENVALVRLGQVSASSFSLFAIAPAASAYTFQYRVAGSGGSWTQPSGALVSQLAFGSASFTYTSLQAATAYEYRVVVTNTNAAASARQFEGTVRTARAAFSAGVTKFAWGSCFTGNAQSAGSPVGYPAFSGPIKAWAYVAKQNPDFLVFLGDFIYSDAPYFINSDAESFATRYRQSLSESTFAAFAAKVPSYFMYDDHELHDNYDSYSLLPSGGQTVCFDSMRCFNSSTIFTNGISAYRAFLHNTNPAAASSVLGVSLAAAVSSEPFAPMYYDFVYGDVPVIVLDARGYRSRATESYTSATKTLLGASQLDYLKRWLLAVNATACPFKFVALPDPVTNFVDPSFDSDDGYAQFPVERDALLDWIESNGIRNVIFLTGDLHIPFHARVREHMHEFSNSPIGGFSTSSTEFVSTDQRPSAMVKRPDMKLEWFSNADTTGFHGVASLWVATIAVDSTVTPATLTVQYFYNKEDKPTYTRTIASR